jgi:hypothetical protein
MRCTAALLSRTYVFAAFDGRWPRVTFLILALSGKLALGPIAPGKGRTAKTCVKSCSYQFNLGLIHIVRALNPTQNYSPGK